MLVSERARGSVPRRKRLAAERMSDATLWLLISFVCACPTSASTSWMTSGREGFSWEE